MKVIGLDLSLTSTGWAVIDDGRLVGQGSIKTGALRDAERLNAVKSAVRQQLLGVDLAGIEGYAYGYSRTKTGAESGGGGFTQAFSAGELGGVIRLLLWELRIPYEVIANASWKLTALGSGRLDKTMVRMEVFKRYQVEIASHDALEAFCIAQAVYLKATGQAKPRVVRKGRAA